MNGLQKLKQGLEVLAPNCREATRLQSEQMEQSLGFMQRVGLRMHLLMCKWCRRYGVQIRFLRLASRREAADLAPANTPGLPAESRARITRKIEEARK